MTYLEPGDWQEAPSPLGIVVSLAESEEWPYEQPSANEVTIVCVGKWADYAVSFTWREEDELLHLACAFDQKIPPHRLLDVHDLVRQINQALWLGHIDLWLEEGSVMYRSALSLGGSSTASASQCYEMFRQALAVCEQYFPAFQAVIWAAQAPADAIKAASISTEGNA